MNMSMNRQTDMNKYVQILPPQTRIHTKKNKKTKRQPKNKHVP